MASSKEVRRGRRTLRRGRQEVPAERKLLAWTMDLERDLRSLKAFLQDGESGS